MKRLCVFCGSKAGRTPYLVDSAKTLGLALVQNQVGLVYGGASVGLMGILADTVLNNGGDVYGVMPQALVDMEVAHNNLQNLEIVPSMHERKQRMYELSDGFVALPGGLGTLDELCEIATWKQLGYHNKPIWVLNINGFFDLFYAHLKKCSFDGLISEEHVALLKEVTSVESLIWDFIHH